MTQRSERGKKHGHQARQYRIDKLRRRAHGPAAEGADPDGPEMRRNVWVDCGWGRLFFAQTFDNLEDMVAELLREKPHQRDIAFYIHDPHVALSLAPQDLFLDPSHTFRLQLDQFEGPMEVLLYLIKAQEIDIFDIPIVTVTEQYLRFLDLMREENLLQ